VARRNHDGRARVASAQNGWANEPHPHPTGFHLLAQKFLGVLKALPNAAT
jgi:hypothetical protein